MWSRLCRFSPRSRANSKRSNTAPLLCLQLDYLWGKDPALVAPDLSEALKQLCRYLTVHQERQKKERLERRAQEERDRRLEAEKERKMRELQA